MSAFLSKLQLVNPYRPSPEVDWETVSLESHPILLTFQDPVAAQEFKVYRHRDIILPVLMIIYSVGAWFFILSDLVYAGDKVWMVHVLAAGAVQGVLALLDFWAFFSYEAPPTTPIHPSATTTTTTDDGSDTSASGHLQLPQTNTNTNITSSNQKERRDKIAHTRWVITTVSNVFLVVEATFASIWFTYDEHCVKSADWVTYLGLRTDPVNTLTSQEVTDQCTRTMSPFLAFVDVLCLTLTSVSTPLLVPIYILAFILRGLAELRPRETVPLLPADLAVQLITTVVLMCVSLCIHWIRCRSSMNQFRQEIALRKATTLLEAREEEVDTLLCNLMPLSALDRLSQGEPVADSTEEASVLFSDVRGFTAWSSTRQPAEVVAMLTILTLKFDLLADSMKVEKIKTIGDAYWAVTGLPEEMDNHAEVLCGFGNAILNVVSSQNRRHPEWEGIAIRVGVHSGPLSGGILGTQQLSYEVFGQTSDIAAMTEQAGTPGRVVVTEDTMRCMGLSEDMWGEVAATLSPEGGIKAPPPQLSIPQNSLHQSLFSCSDRGAIPAEEGGEMAEERRHINLYSLPPINRRGTNHAAATAGNVSALPIYKGASRAGEASSLRVLDIGSSRSRLTDAASSSNRSRITAALDVGSVRSAHSASGSVYSLMKRNNAGSRASGVRQSIWSTPSGVGGDHDQDLAKQRRTQFLALRASKASSPDDPNGNNDDEATLQSITVRYSKRRYKYVFYVFDDPVVENSFIEDLAEKSKQLRIASRVCLLVFLIMVLINIGINQGTFSAASVVLFPSSGVVMLVDLVLCFLQPLGYLYPRVQVALQTLGVVLLLLAAGLMPLGASTATNNIIYLFLIAVMPLGFGNVGFVNWAFLGLIAFSILPVVVWLTWASVTLTTGTCFLVVASIFQLPVFVVTERLYRLQFLQHYIAEYFNNQQKQRTKEQEELLSSIVPAHIVPELMQWMHTGMDPAKAIVQRLPMTAIAFVQVRGGIRRSTFGSSAPSTSSFPQEQLRLLPHLPAAAPPLPPPLSGSSGSSSISQPQAEDHPDTNHHNNVGLPSQPEPRGSALSTNSVFDSGQGSQVDERPAASTAAPSPGSRRDLTLQEIHAKIDALLNEHCKSVVKIKTVGDMVMLAGPFVPQYDLTESCDEMLAAVWRIHTTVAGIRAGLHCGELVGAVLGNSRLCFDLFGDTVNVASRCMTSGGVGDISISSAFFKSLPHCRTTVAPRLSSSKTEGDGVSLIESNLVEVRSALLQPPVNHTPNNNLKWCTDNAVFAEDLVDVAAKGKGTISVHRLLRVGSEA